MDDNADRVHVPGQHGMPERDIEPLWPPEQIDGFGAPTWAARRCHPPCHLRPRRRRRTADQPASGHAADRSAPGRGTGLSSPGRRTGLSIHDGGAAARARTADARTRCTSLTR